MKIDLIVIEVGSDSKGAPRGVEAARNCASDILLRGEGVRMAVPGGLEGFCGTAYAVAEDLSARGITAVVKGLRVITATECERMLADRDVTVIEVFSS